MQYFIILLAIAGLSYLVYKRWKSPKKESKQGGITEPKKDNKDVDDKDNNPNED